MHLKKLEKRVKGVLVKVVGNKTDLILLDELKTVLDGKEISYDYLTSAKTGEKVNDLFEQLAKMLALDAEKI